MIPPLDTKNKFPELANTWRSKLIIFIIFIYSLTISCWNLGKPGFWGDEAASITTARKPWGDFFSTILQVDAVHAAYYAFLKCWIYFVDVNEFSTRFPSALAVALTSALIFSLGKKVSSNTSIAIVAAFIYPLIPSVIWSASEARPFAISAFWATLSVYFWASYIDSSRKIYLYLFTASIIFSTYLFLFFALALPSFLAITPRDRLRKEKIRILGVLSVYATFIIPLALNALHQRGQLSWIPNLSTAELVKTILTEQYFGGILSSAIVFGILFFCGLFNSAEGLGKWRIFCISWCFVPTAILASTNFLLSSPLYQFRYLIFTIPIFTFVVAQGIVNISLGVKFIATKKLNLYSKTSIRLAQALPALLIIISIAFTGSPKLIERNNENSKSSWIFVQKTLAQHAQSSDGLITFSPLMTASENVYSDPAQKMTLINKDENSPWMIKAIYDRMGGSLETSLNDINQVSIIWYVSDKTSRDWGVSNIEDDLNILKEHGFFPAEQYEDSDGIDQVTIYKLVKQ